MIIVLSGEGPTDLGRCNDGAGKCKHPEFIPGPMTILIDDIIERTYQYRPLEIDPDAYRFVHKKTLIERAKAQKGNRPMVLAGKKHGAETGYFYINAWMLGEIAKAIEVEQNDKSVSILFRDTDGTNSAPAGLWQSKWDSMINGFKRADYAFGVPMLPMPKSEAWLLCAAKAVPYQNCLALESLSGNDDAPESAKDLLRQALHGHTSAIEVQQWLSENRFNDEATAAQMPSFNAFRRRLLDVLVQGVE